MPIRWLLSLFLFLPCISHASIAFVQVSISTGTNSTAVSLPSTTAGNLIVAVVGSTGTLGTISLSDSGGNSYALASGPLTHTATGNIYYAKNIVGGADIVTATAAGDVQLFIHEYSGASTTNPFDVQATGTADDTTCTTGSATTSSANELIFGTAFSQVQVSVGGSSGLTQRSNEPVGGATGDKIGINAGSYNVAFDIDLPLPSVCLMATFQSTPTQKGVLFRIQ